MIINNANLSIESRDWRTHLRCRLVYPFPNFKVRSKAPLNGRGKDKKGEKVLKGIKVFRIVVEPARVNQSEPDA